jgi:hypothetical protein
MNPEKLALNVTPKRKGRVYGKPGRVVALINVAVLIIGDEVDVIVLLLAEKYASQRVTKLLVAVMVWAASTFATLSESAVSAQDIVVDVLPVASKIAAELTVSVTSVLRVGKLNDALAAVLAFATIDRLTGVGIFL